MDTLIEIGKRVRKTREHYKLTREQLAEMASISPQFLVHIKWNEEYDLQYDL